MEMGSLIIERRLYTSQIADTVKAVLQKEGCGSTDKKNETLTDVSDWGKLGILPANHLTCHKISKQNS